MSTCLRRRRSELEAENQESAVYEMASRLWDWRCLSTQRRERYPSGLASLSLIFSTTQRGIMLALRIETMKGKSLGRLPACCSVL